ncbi:MAG: Spx/MgsR family RNA polymerase-binding regulatory protein [Ferruginibacter sp.]|nr:Spx/MgsR family RNA polymerase-binding regulatory protein [Ferruginibacter sp.]
MIKVYGIPNCDTVKKAVKWLEENNIVFEFHDFKKEGITALKLKEWLKTIPLDQILNKKSTAYRNLMDDEKQLTTINTEAIKLMQTNTNLIKRPVLEIAGTILCGFNEESYKATFRKK